MSSPARRTVLIVAAALIAWYVCVVVTWAAKPLSDAVPIGVDYSPTALTPPKPARQISQTVECNTLFESAARDSSPLPLLAVQPPTFPVLTYSRGACSAVQREARIVFGLDTLVLGLALGGLVMVARRLGATPPPPRTPSQSSSPERVRVPVGV